jgi:hypothetical protein
VAAGKLNHAKRRGLTPEGRERLRLAALVGQPWQHATGPRTPEGKATSALNARTRQKGEQSVRAVRRSIAELTGLVSDMAGLRALAGELLAAKS